jgi:hypothetical protein
MTALIVVLPLIVVVEISLQLHRSFILDSNSVQFLVTNKCFTSQLEVLMDQDDHPTYNIDLGTGPDQVIQILHHNILLGLNFLEEMCWLC